MKLINWKKNDMPTKNYCYVKINESKNTFKIIPYEKKIAPRNIHPITEITEGYLKDFLIRQLDVKKNPKGNRFNYSEKMFSLSLWHSSPKCYRLLRSTFSLPLVTTLRRSIHSIDMRAGFHSRILEGINQKATTYTLIQESLITIVFDEMSIKSSLNYDERLVKVVGYQDL